LAEAYFTVSFVLFISDVRLSLRSSLSAASCTVNLLVPFCTVFRPILSLVYLAASGMICLGAVGLIDLQPCKATYLLVLDVVKLNCVRRR